MNVPATSWSNKVVNGSSATTVGTTVTSYSESLIPSQANSMTINKPTSMSQKSAATTNNQNVNNSGVVIIANNSSNNNGNNNGNVQNNQVSSANANTQNTKGNRAQGANLPQTGETGVSTLIGLGIVLIIGLMIVIDSKQH